MKRLFTPFTASLIRLQILKRLKIRADVYFFFLPLLWNAAIIEYNAACGAVIVPAVRKSTQAPAVAGVYLLSGRRIDYVSQLQKALETTYRQGHQEEGSN